MFPQPKDFTPDMRLRYAASIKYAQTNSMVWDVLHLDSPLQCQTGVGFSCDNDGGSWSVCVCVRVGVGGWFILTSSLLLSPLSWERHYLAVCLPSSDPRLPLLAISSSIRLKTLPHAPRWLLLCHSIWATWISGVGANWSLYGSESVSATLFRRG